MDVNGFGRRLEEKRRAKKISQDALAVSLGKKSRTTISQWELGKAEPTVSELQVLANLLDTTVAYLVDGIGDQPGYRMVSDEEWDTRNKQLIDMQQQLLLYQKKEIARQTT